jgi:hypothetical protein
VDDFGEEVDIAFGVFLRYYDASLRLVLLLSQSPCFPVGSTLLFK